MIIKPTGQGRVPCSGANKLMRVIVFSITVRIEEGPKYSNIMEVKKIINLKKNKKQLQQKHNKNVSGFKGGSVKNAMLSKHIK